MHLVHNRPCVGHSPISSLILLYSANMATHLLFRKIKNRSWKKGDLRALKTKCIYNEGDTSHPTLPWGLRFLGLGTFSTKTRAFQTDWPLVTYLNPNLVYELTIFFSLKHLSYLFHKPQKTSDIDIKQETTYLFNKVTPSSHQSLLYITDLYICRKMTFLH